MVKANKETERVRLDKEISNLMSEDWKTRKYAVVSLGNSNDNRAVKPLVESLRDPNPYVRERTVSALIRLGRLSVPSVIDCLDDKSWFVRNKAAFILGRIGEACALTPLTKALSDRNKKVRVSAANAITRLEIEDKVDVLISAMKNTDGSVRAVAAKALVNLNSSRIRKTLISALQDESAECIAASALSLGGFGDKKAVKPLISALQRCGKDARASIIRALGMLGDKRAAEHIAAALDDEDMFVHSAAVEALAKIRDPKTIPALLKAVDKNDSYFGDIDPICSIAAMGEQAAQPLRLVFETGTGSQKHTVMDSIKEDKASWTSEILLHALSDKDSSVRSWAAQYLGHRREIDAVEPLIAALKDKENRAVVVGALGLIADKRAIEPLLEVLALEQDQSIREDIQDILKKLDQDILS